MISENAIVCVSKSIGQVSNSDKSTIENVICDRYQDESTTDFIPCLFAVNGSFFDQNRCFANIECINPFTIEQCLGDELLKHVSKHTLLRHTILLNEHNRTFAYAFSNGIKYHALNEPNGRNIGK